VSQKFQIQGMTCLGCADTIQTRLRKESDVISAEVSFENEELLLESKVPVDDEYIDSIISNLGNYNVKNQNATLFSKFLSHLNSKKPILLALMIVIVSSLSLQTPLRNFDLDNWFITYMGLFFMLFSFLKLLNIKGFSITFSKYDLLGKNFPGFAVSYPFLEFCLGIAFLTNSLLIIANLATLIFMISQCVGVANVLRKKEVIQCACLGSSINLPVSYLTLVENLVMVSMSSYMLFTLLS
jgi:copper chaperone CopZ